MRQIAAERAALLAFLLLAACTPAMRGGLPAPKIEAASNPQEEMLDAIGFGDVKKTKRLLDGGGDPNQRTPEGFTLLMIAAEDGRVELARLLLERGADVNATNEAGVTPLILAAAKGGPEVARELLERGADRDAVTKPKTTASMAAAAAGKLDALVVIAGDAPNPTNLDAVDEGGRTALMFAVANGHLEVVRWLLAHGARLDVKDSAGDSAETLAKKAHRRDIELVLGGEVAKRTHAASTGADK